MHILVINDDGPPSSTASPYVHSFVLALRANGHKVSVVLPHVQRSWIGKAHFVHETARPTYFRPGTQHEDNGTTHDRPLPADAEGDEWVLVNGTPATCAQLGLFHFYKDRGPVDLVVSGPNFGRNSTSLFSLSSGTIGGAMEATCCGYKSIALSFAFDREVRYNRGYIEKACRLGARLAKHLGRNWDDGTDLYNINIPLGPDVETRKVYWTSVLQNFWRSGPSYKPIEKESEESASAEQDEAKVRDAEGSVDAQESLQNPTKVEFSRHEHRDFKWVPSFADIHNSVKDAKEGTDGWAILNNCTSVTPLKANFMHAASHEGELKLDSANIQATMHEARFQTFVHYEDDYVQPLIEAALAELMPSWKPAERALKEDTAQEPFLQISQYETIDHSQLFERSSTFMANSYIIRKALIRKEYLASVCQYWAAKNPEATLSKCLPQTVSMHLDYAEFLEDALMEGDGMELIPIMAKNAGVDPLDRSWWIVKASMADRGQGIQLFSTFDELQEVFGGWDPPLSDEEEDEENDEDEEEETTNDGPHGLGQSETGKTDMAETGYAGTGEDGEGMTSQLRHFVLQRYIEPLILSAKADRKFHIRCYVLAVGALKVYVYRDMLALFSAKKYEPPMEHAGNLDLGVHLTNTCLQDGTREGSVERFWDLPDLESQPGWKEAQFESICKATVEIFQAAKASPTDFQPLPNAFELYGVDWLVGYSPAEGPTNERQIQPVQPWLLEVNAFPDLKQSGNDLKDTIGGLWKGIVTAAVAPFFKVDVKGGKKPENFGMVNVLNLDMRR